MLNIIKSAKKLPHKIWYSKDHSCNSRLFEWYHNRWYTKMRATCWKDPTWAAIETKRYDGGTPGTVLFLSDDLTMEDWDLQNKIEDKLYPHTWVHEVHWWMVKNGYHPTMDKIRKFIQRGKRGWADSDVWGLDDYLTEVMIETLEKLSEDKHGYPANLNSSEEWEEILKTIIKGLKNIKLIKDNNLGAHYTPEDYEGPPYEFLEQGRELAFDLLKEHWYSLWD